MERDFGKVGDNVLVALAARAFHLGLRDGRKLDKPRDSVTVIRALTKGGDKWQVIHRRKFRQVYGAGFDMAKAMAFAAGKGRA